MYSVSVEASCFSVQVSSCVSVNASCVQSDESHVSVRRLIMSQCGCFIKPLLLKVVVQSKHIIFQPISLSERPPLSLHNVLEPKGVVDRDDHRYIRIRKPRRKRRRTHKGEVAGVRRHTVVVVCLIRQRRAGLHPEPLPGFSLLCAPGYGAPRYDVADIHDHRL